MPLKKIRNILDNYKETNYFKTLFFVDFACSAPYVDIDGSMFDGLVFSGHKFHGGVGTPGVMIAKEYLFNKTIPHDTGGGCVCKCTSNEVVYEKDIEKRESAGTPNIIGIIKLGKVIRLKNDLIKIIKKNEKIICFIIRQKINEFEKKYPEFVYILNNYENEEIEHVPIFTFNLKNAHYNFIVVLLNDLFGIQSRGGISCCGLLGEYIENKFKVNGWCRISFYWTMSYDIVMKIFDSVEYIIKEHKKYSHMYTYNKCENLFYYNDQNII
jgi:selenocysteine lyase/cysteine desulfurase